MPPHQHAHLSLIDRYYIYDHFQLDAADAGVKERWFTRPLDDAIPLPGSTDRVGKGKPKRPDRELAGRLTRAFEYTGAVCYQREIYVPAGWDGKNVVVFLERVHWESLL